MKTTKQKIKIFQYMPAMTELEWLDLYNNMYIDSFSYKKNDIRYLELINSCNKIKLHLKFKTI